MTHFLVLAEHSWRWSCSKIFWRPSFFHILSQIELVEYDPDCSISLANIATCLVLRHLFILLYFIYFFYCCRLQSNWCQIAKTLPQHWPRCSLLRWDMLRWCQYHSSWSSQSLKRFSRLNQQQPMLLSILVSSSLDVWFIATNIFWVSAC